AGPPSLLMLGSRLGGRDGLEVARAVRKGGDGGDKDVPIVLVAASEAEADRAAGAEAGITDWLVAPFSMLYARTRVRPWALADPRFADNPVVADGPRLRFYAGRPVHVDGRRVGTLCVVDNRPRNLGEEDKKALDDLAALVEKELG